jgi:hypothetical protein
MASSNVNNDFADLKKHLTSEVHRDNVNARLIRESSQPGSMAHPLIVSCPTYSYAL